MRQLIHAGYLEPGPSAVYVEYKGLTTHGDLNKDGQIKCNGLTFESPSAFSIYIKRLANPTRKADDGWKSVKFAGKLLEHYKYEYLRTKYQSDGDAGGAGAPPPPAPALSNGSSAARAASEDEPAAKRVRAEENGGGTSAVASAVPPVPPLYVSR